MGEKRRWIKYDPIVDALYITSTKKLNKENIHMVDKAVKAPATINIIYLENRTRDIVGLEIAEVSQLLKPVIDSICLQTGRKAPGK